MSEHGHIWWTELMTRDPERAAKFYGEVVGWTTAEVCSADPRRPPKPGEDSYMVFRRGDEAVCGVMRMQGPEYEGMPDCWFTYISVDDVDEVVRRTKEKGGAVLRPVFEVPGIGRIAIIADPEGAVVGIGTPVIRELA